jgi:hypothetical protein
VNVRDLARRTAFEAKTVVARYPSLAIPIARRRHGVPVGPATDVVIEGFPRTGTSFAVAAFNLAQPHPLNVACHVHAPAQVVAAVRAGLPSLVIVREPEDTVLSFVIRNPYIAMAQAIRGYIRFYAPLLPLRAGFVTASFAEVSKDFGAVTRRINDRFGTRFGEFEHNQQMMAKVFGEIEDDYRGRLSGDALERSVARPSAVRAGLKEQLRSAYHDPKVGRGRHRADGIFEAYVR